LTKDHDAAIDPWRTGITSYDDTHIWFHGHDVTSLMKGASFTDCIFLHHRGRLPTADELAWAVEMLLDPEAGILHGSVLYLDAGGHRGIG